MDSYFLPIYHTPICVFFRRIYFSIKNLPSAQQSFLFKNRPLVILSLSTEAAVLWHDQFSNEPILNSIFGDSPAIFYEPTFSMKSNPIKVWLFREI